MPGLAQTDRTALCDLMAGLGPDAPTLCDGWTTHDLAAHLVVRESKPQAVPGLVLPGPLRRWTERMTAETRASTAYDVLLDRLRTGPPLGPLGLPGLTDAANVHEFFVHREDVARANGHGPRALSSELEGALWTRLRLFGWRLFSGVGDLAVELQRRDGHSVTVRAGTVPVRVIGDPGEQFLFAFGRTAVAQVDLVGDDDAVARLLAAPRGL